MGQVYEGVFNFNCFFNDLKAARDERRLLSFNYLNYIEREDCKSIPVVSFSPFLNPPVVEGIFSSPAPSIKNFFAGKLFKDKYLEIENEEGRVDSILVYDRNISLKNGIIDPNQDTTFGIGEMAYTNNGKVIIRPFHIYFQGERSSSNRALYLLLTYSDLKLLLSYLNYSYKEVSINSAREWFKNRLDVNKNSPNYLAVLYEFLPLEFLTSFSYDKEFFKKQLYVLTEAGNFQAVLNFMKLWLSHDSDSLYVFMNTDLILFYIYSKFTEEYGDRKEIAEYVALLTILHGLYAENHKILSKIFDMPVNEEFLFEVNAITSSGEGKIRVKTFTEEKRLWSYTPERNYRETKIFRPLETLTYRTIVDANDLDSESLAFAKKIPGTNQVVFFSDVPVIFFYYQYEEEYVKYINRGRVEFAINAITSIANLGITKAIFSPSSKIVFKFAVAEAVFESLHQAISNPIVTSQLQQSATGSYFLYIWNNYVSRVGNAIFIIHGFSEILVSLGKSKKVIDAIAKSGDPQAVKNLAKLTENGTKTLRNALNLSDDAVKVLSKKGWRVVTDRKNILIEDYTGKVFASLKPYNVNTYLVYWKLTKSVKRNKLKDMYLLLKKHKFVYKPNKAIKNGYDVPKSSVGKTSADFRNTPYLYDHPKSSVKIQLTGSSSKDEQLAFELMGITEKKLIKKIMQSHTWHHLDDMDEGLNCTMQLVKRNAHKGISKHLGGVLQFETIINIKYIR
jgi:hypothetical protein